MVNWRKKISQKICKITILYQKNLKRNNSVINNNSERKTNEVTKTYKSTKVTVPNNKKTIQETKEK